MMEFHARTYSSLAEQIQAVRERRARLGFNAAKRNKEPGRIDATVRPPIDDELDERTYRRRAQKAQEARQTKPEPRAFDEHVKDFYAHVVRFGGSPSKAYIFYRCQALMLPYVAVTGPTRIRHIVAARQLLMWEVKHKFNLTLNEIARLFSGRDHTTVLHALRRVQAMIDAGEMRNPLTGRYEPKEGAADGP